MKMIKVSEPYSILTRSSTTRYINPVAVNQIVCNGTYVNIYIDGGGTVDVHHTTAEEAEAYAAEVAAQVEEAWEQK